MKPYLLVTLDYPPRLGGVATYLSRLAECFPPDRLAVLAPEEGNTHEVDMESTAPIYRRRLLWRFLKPGWLPALYWTRWLCRKEPPAGIIVSHLLPMGEVAFLMKQRKRIPYAVIVHGFDVALAAQAGGRKRALAKRVLTAADLVVANSAYTANMAAALGAAPDRLMVARPSPGMPTYVTVPPEARAEARRRLAKDDEFLLLSVGRLVERKGFDSCLKAVAELRRGGKPVRYAIVGAGPDRTRLEKLATELGIADVVTFTGAVPEEDKPAVFAAADAFVMVPRSVGPDIEGFGIVYLEASLFGKPVIGSRSGGVPEAVLDGITGLLVDPLDVAGLVGAVRRLMEERGLAERLGQAGRQRVIDEFGWRRQFRPVIERLEKIVADRA